MDLHTEVESDAFQLIGIGIAPKVFALRFSGVGEAEVYSVSAKLCPRSSIKTERLMKTGSSRPSVLRELHLLHRTNTLQNDGAFTPAPATAPIFS